MISWLPPESAALAVVIDARCVNGLTAADPRSVEPEITPSYKDRSPSGESEGKTALISGFATTCIVKITDCPYVGVAGKADRNVVCVGALFTVKGTEVELLMKFPLVSVYTKMMLCEPTERVAVLSGIV